MKRYAMSVVDVGVANAKYAAVTLAEMQQYLDNSNNFTESNEPRAVDVNISSTLVDVSKQRSRRSPTVAAFVNACGASWGQRVNDWLADGTPVVNSVCSGPSNPTNYLCVLQFIPNTFLYGVRV